MRLPAYIIAVVLSLQLALLSTAQAAQTAAVAVPELHAANAARAVLEDGGNAIDAAVATAFALAVTYPEAGNIGGGGFMISYMKGEAAFLDFRERAPGAAHRDMFLDEGGNFLQNDTLVGGRASGIPGTVAGMIAAHTQYGSLPWERLLTPAITLARHGFKAPAGLADMAAHKVVELGGSYNFSEYFGHMRTGEVFKQPELAVTLQRIANDPQSFYTGLIARQLVAQVTSAGGIITLEDMAAYEAKWRTPLKAEWRGYTVYTSSPPSSGGFALMQLLEMRDIADVHFGDVWHNSAEYIHLLAEIEKRVFADRAEYLGDPDFVDVPMDQLLDAEYLQRRAAEINPQAISPAADVPPGLESTDTTHFSILDQWGNAVSLTYTLNWDFGSGLVVEGAGFLLNNEMDDFAAKTGVPNKFGVIGSDRNSIAPGKRMLSSLTPAILLKDGEPALVIGTPGGSTIFTSVFQVILNLFDYNMPLQQAVNTTRYHNQLPAARLIRHDQREISPDTRSALEKMGYEVVPNSWGHLGDIQAIYIHDDVVEAAADNRGRGHALLIPPPDGS